MKKKIFQIFLALIITLLLPITVKAQSTSWTDAATLPTTAGDYTLATDVTVTANYGAPTGTTTIDLAGHTITTPRMNIKNAAELVINDSANTGSIKLTGAVGFLVINGKLTINGGTIKNEKAGMLATIAIEGSTDSTASNYSVVNFNANAKLVNDASGSTYYAILVDQIPNSNASYGVVANIKGTIDVSPVSGNSTVSASGVYVNGTVNKTTGNIPEFNIYPSAKVTVPVTANKFPTDTSVLIYGAGYAKWNITGGTFKGEQGIEIKSGELNISGGTVNVDGAYIDPAVGNNNGTEDTGAAIGITSNDGYAKQIKVNITGGTFTSNNGYALYEGIALKNNIPKAAKTNVTSLTISDGVFEGSKGALLISNYADIATKSVTGGVYSSNPAQYTNLVVVDNPGSEAPKADYPYSISTSYNRVESDTNPVVTTEVVNYYKDEKEALVLVFNGLADEFTGLKIDGNLVDSSNYTKKSGSTIITLNASYASTLETGTHNVEALYNKGTAEATLNVLSTEVANPQTSDNIMTYITMAILSLGLSIAVIIYNKKISVR